MSVCLLLNIKQHALSVNLSINISVAITTGADMALEGSTWYG
jgi:hypothetical protein